MHLEPLLTDADVVTTYFSQHRPVRKVDAQDKSVLFHLTRFASTTQFVMLHANKHFAFRIFLEKPLDYDKKPYWSVYATHWNNFAAYNDHLNSNKAYELECYVDVVVGSGIEVGGIEPTPRSVSDWFSLNYNPSFNQLEKDAVLINDCISSLFEYMGAKGNYKQAEKRVSHAIFSLDGQTPIVEKCFQAAVKTRKRRVWEFFE